MFSKLSLDILEFRSKFYLHNIIIIFHSSTTTTSIDKNHFHFRISSIRHSPSDPQLNRPNTGQSRATNMYRNFIGNTPLSARNVSTTKKPTKAQILANPKVESRVVPQLRPSVGDTEKAEFVPMSADKPFGLDAENFLPVSSISIYLHHVILVTPSIYRNFFPYYCRINMVRHRDIRRAEFSVKCRRRK